MTHSGAIYFALLRNGCPERESMVHETITSAGREEVLTSAVRFFAERIPHHAAFPERLGSHHVVLRGQGGEEVALAVLPGSREGVTRVRASTLFYDQAVTRFLSLLPPAADTAA